METKESGPKEEPSAFDAIAEAFDAWFARNANVFESELLATGYFLTDPADTVSIGCGTGLFEERLGIRRGCEPAEGMARLARKRGIDVKIGPAEAVPFGDATAGCVLMSTILSYVKDRPKAMSGAFRVLKPGGTIILSNLEFVEEGTWGSTDEVIRRLKGAGFVDLEVVQTLTRHPKYTNDSVEEPVPGYDKGDFVVVRARKP
jgi:ubiquinone/menaquinone biosynthesis C-methylase UbiE